ncbi:hypothetical protein NQ318_002029 [Aromia moschata]|uniref:Uncharacterized protein n=1 Tax=Aromia moschata TaxID=1265417 RepID=A0AAV8Z2A0_9CUCU|nr:hypothetical protein NQ318_002029 [Aromia moschata]
MIGKNYTSKQCLRVFVPVDQALLNLPLPSRLHGLLGAPYFPLVSIFFEFLISLSVDDVEKISACIRNIEEGLSNLVKFVEDNTLKKSKRFSRQEEIDGVGSELRRVTCKLKDDIGAICDILQKWTDLSITDDINSKFEALNLNSCQNVVQNVLNSYEAANKEIQSALKNKIKLLGGLTG